jgi:hypothetical protein
MDRKEVIGLLEHLLEGDNNLICFTRESKVQDAIRVAIEMLETPGSTAGTKVLIMWTDLEGVGHVTETRYYPDTAQAEDFVKQFNDAIPKSYISSHWKEVGEFARIVIDK